MDGRRRIAVINQKGGSTKTTTSVNLAAALAARGRVVRLIDMDPQEGSATHWLPPQKEAGEGLLRVFKDECSLDEVTVPTGTPGVFIVPSYQSLRAVEMTRQPGSDIVMQAALRETSLPIDYEIEDCPHSMDVLSIAGIAGAEELIVPVQASGLDIVGMKELLDLAAMIRRRLNPTLRISAVVIGRVKGASGFDARLIAKFRGEYPDAAVVSVADTVKMREATAAKKPINAYDPKGRATADFAALAAAIDGGAAA